MNERPQTHYAKSGDVHIAYQVVGDGPLDLVVTSGWISHIEVAWESPAYSRFLERLASFSRLIIFDRRGTGASDRVHGVPTLEERMDDVRVVMDAARSDTAAIAGWFDASPLCMLFAATFPERTSALVLGSAIAKFTPDAEFPYGPDLDLITQSGPVEDSWGEGTTVATHSPTAAADAQFMAWWRRFERLAASPASAAAFLYMSLELDVRSVLPRISVPTLVIHRSGELLVPIDSGRWVADHIPEAKFVELPGVDALPYVGDWESITDAVEEFLTGHRHVAEPDRVLATVLFTDIVGSTERAALLGDRQWRELLDHHDETVRRRLADFGGRAIKTMGDGVLATFDGPGRAVRCACAIRDGLADLGIQIRAGVHTGEIEILGADVGGIAVHIGQRVSALAGPGEVLVSRTVVDLVAGSGIEFEDRGEQELKGVGGTWRLFAVAPEVSSRSAGS